MEDLVLYQAVVSGFEAGVYNLFGTSHTSVESVVAALKSAGLWEKLSAAGAYIVSFETFENTNPLRLVVKSRQRILPDGLGDDEGPGVFRQTVGLNK